MNHQTCHLNCLVLEEAVYKHGVPEFRYDETNIKGGGGVVRQELNQKYNAKCAQKFSTIRKLWFSSSNLILD